MRWSGTRLALGDHVVALLVPSGPHGGAYADYVVVPPASVVSAPVGVDFLAASTSLMNALTARLALDALGLTSGQTVAVTGSAGALGGFPIHLARAEGLRPLSLTRRRPTRISSALLARTPSCLVAMMWRRPSAPSSQAGSMGCVTRPCKRHRCSRRSSMAVA